MNFKILFFIILLAFYSCNDDTLLDLEIGDKVLHIEIASTDEERMKGLMYRESLKMDRGMLFIFDQERAVSFWMKNTFIPLSIAYIDKRGKILEIHDMYPLSTNPVSSKGASIKYALEVNQGYFEKNNIKIGNFINIEKINDYLNSSK